MGFGLCKKVFVGNMSLVPDINVDHKCWPLPYYK